MKTSLFLLTRQLQFGIGEKGESEPLIFKSQATFSGALINK